MEGVEAKLSEESMQENSELRAGYVAIVGRPNVGKSTLMNALVGARVSIATHKPQTTRNRIVGIVTDKELGQIAFVDTPGIHRATGTLNRRMVRAAWDAAGQTHAAVLVVDVASLVQRPAEPLWGADLEIYEGLQETGVPIILVINKLDTLKRRSDLLPALQTISDTYPFHAVVPLSARKKKNLDPLLQEIFAVLPQSPLLYEEDMITDRPEFFTAAELIREQVFRQIQQEVPYGVTVTVDSISEDVDSDRLFIEAVIHVEREIYKGIIIGRGGHRLGEIGKSSRHALKHFFGRPIHLKLFVRVQHKWTERERDLDQFGLSEDDI